MGKVIPALHELLEPAVSAIGLELWGCELISQEGQSVLRVYVENPNEGGVTLDDCTRASRQVSAVMDVEDPIKCAYHLEVSSPGVERPLFNMRHYERNVGHGVNLRLRMPKDGKRRLIGQILSVDMSKAQIVLEVEDEKIALTLDEVDKAKLVVDV